MRLLLNWVLSALAVWIVAQVVPGVYVNGAMAALINATIGFVLKVLTCPLTLLTLGLFWFVINALMLDLASALVPGFHVRSFFAAFMGAIVLSLVNLLLKAIVMPKANQR